MSPFEVKVIARNLAGYSGEQLYRIWCKLSERYPTTGFAMPKVAEIIEAAGELGYLEKPKQRPAHWLLFDIGTRKHAAKVQDPSRPPGLPDGATGEHLAVDHVFYEQAISADQGGTDLFREAYLKAGGKMDHIGVYLNAIR